MTKRIALFTLALGAALALLGLGACKDKPKDPDASFDRGKMLEHYANNIIIPAFEDLQQKSSQLKNTLEALSTAPDSVKLETARQEWKACMESWMTAGLFNMGPADEQGITKKLLEEIGTFPVSTTKLENYISANDHSFSNFDRDTRGFMAIEFLIFGYQESHAAVLVQLQDPKRRDYLNAVGKHLDQKVSNVLNGWKNGYAASFISNKGTDAGSSVTQLYNDFLWGYENLKNYKIGIPGGKRAGQTAPEPTKAEAYYSQLSTSLLKKNWEAVKRVWHGESLNGKAGSGFKAYLQEMEGGADLIDRTSSSMAKIDAAFAQLPEQPAFAELCLANDARVATLFNEFSQHTRFFKSEMSSLLGIVITYASGDGD